MLSKLFNYIHDLKRPETIKSNDREYMISDYSPVKEPVVASININTLTGMVDYINAGIDEEEEKIRFIHISSFSQVFLQTEVFGKWQQRELLLDSIADTPRSISGEWMNTERFIISLNSLFEHTEDYQYLVQLISGLSESSARELKDNGISQSTTIKSGVSMVTEQQVKNPITLQPFRTFPEIEQPKIEYIFRFKKGRDGQPPECALFEADGGRWKLETVHKIKAWFEGQFEDLKINIIA